MILFVSYKSLYSAVPQGIVKLTTGIFNSDSRAEAVKIQTDGKIVVCGYTTVSGHKRWTVARFTSTGFLDTSFNTTGYWQSTRDDTFAKDITIKSDGTIFVGGKHPIANGTNNYTRIISYNTSGVAQNYSATGGATEGLGNYGVGLSFDLAAHAGISIQGPLWQSTGPDVISVRYNGFMTNNLTRAVSGTGVLPPTFSTTYSENARGGMFGLLSGTYGYWSVCSTESFSVITRTVTNTGAFAGPIAVRSSTDVTNPITGKFGYLAANNLGNDTAGILVTAMCTGGFQSTVAWNYAATNTAGIASPSTYPVVANNLTEYPYGFGGGIAFTDTLLTPSMVMCACNSSKQPFISRQLPTGTLDTSFNNTGINLETSAQLSPAFYSSVALQSTGKAIVAGFTEADGAGAARWIIARYNTDGTRDTAFGIILTGVLQDTASPFNTGATGLLYSTTITQAGNLVVGGQYNNTWQVISYTPGGVRNGSFGSSGVAAAPASPSPNDFTGGRVRAIALDSTGRIIATGATVNGASPEYFTTVRYNAAGTSSDTIREAAYGVSSGLGVEVNNDDSFMIPGFSTTGVTDVTPTIITYSSAFAQTYIAQYSAASMIPGYFYAVKETNEDAFATGSAEDTAILFSLIDGTGLLQDTATPFGLTQNGIMYGGMYDNANRIVLCGTYNNIFSVVRYSSVGERDPFTVGVDGVLQEPSLGVASGYAITQDSAGSYYVAAQSTVSSTLVFTVVKYLSTGVLDATFGNGGIIQETTLGVGKASAIKVNADGTVLVGGQTTVNGVLLPTLITYTVTGARLSTFGTNGVQTFNNFDTGTLNSLTIISISTIAAAGQMGSVATLVEFGQSSDLITQLTNGF